jgi:hypothetical protein
MLFVGIEIAQLGLDADKHIKTLQSYEAKLDFAPLSRGFELSFARLLQPRNVCNQ